MNLRWIIPVLAAGVVALSGFGKTDNSPPAAQAGPASRPTVLLWKVDDLDGFRGGKFADALDLTDEQKAQVQSILEAGRDKITSLRGDRERLKAFFEEQKAKLDAVLTPEQKARLEELRKKWRANLPTGFRVLVGLAEALDLTDGQKGKICSSYAAYSETVWVFRFVLTGAGPSVQTLWYL